MLVISDYTSTWPQEFETIRDTLQEILGPLALRIDHIGSTAVPGLGAKNIIDVQVTVASLAPAVAAEIEHKMLAAGYEGWPKIKHDHVPADADTDIQHWEKRFFQNPHGQRRANIHIRVQGNPNQRYALLFRDYLRAHPLSVKSLELIKREIVKRHPEDLDAYYDIKDPVCDLIWDAAQDWARQTNWSPAN